MEKKANPWVAALQKKKAAVDLHPDVLRAVLKMNPSMRGDGRSTEEVAEGLINDLPVPGKPGAQPAFSDDKFRAVFADMLEQFAGQHQKDLLGLVEKRKQIDEEEARLRDSYVERVVEFLAEVQPGPMTDSAREIILENIELFRALKAEPSEIGRRVREKSAAYSVKR